MEFCVTVEKEKISLFTTDGTLAGTVLLPAISSSLSNITSVYVHPDFRGQGVAGQLMTLAVKQLEENKRHMVLTCTYAQKWVKEHPAFHHLLASNIYFEKK